jgi:hypothetical protein
VGTDLFMDSARIQSCQAASSVLVEAGVSRDASIVTGVLWLD